MLKQVRKKALDNILRVSSRVPAAPNESVKWRPVGFGKRRERLARGLVRIGLPRLEDDRPMRRLERRAALVQRSGNRFRSDPQCA